MANIILRMSGIGSEKDTQIQLNKFSFVSTAVLCEMKERPSISHKKIFYLYSKLTIL